MTLATWNTDVLAVQNGTEVATGSSEITYYDTLRADASGKYFTNFTAVGTVGSEIGYLYIVNDDGTYGKSYQQSAVAGLGKFTYSSGTKEITFTEGDAPIVGEYLACAYKFKTASNAQKIQINSDGVPPVVLVSAYGIARDTCTGELFPCVIEGQTQVDGNWNFDLSADGEPVVQNLSMEFVKGCISNELYSFTVFTEDEEVLPPEHIALVSPTGDVYGKDAADLSTNLVFAQDGKVSGTLKYVTDYVGFNGTDTSEQNGYYLPFVVTAPADKKENMVATMQVNNKAPVTMDVGTGTSNVIFMGKDETVGKTKTITLKIDWDGPDAKYPTEILVLDMKDVAYAAKA